MAGMRLDDVYAMTLEELGHVLEAWHRAEEARVRTSWEQARFVAQCVLMPYSKKKLEPEDIVVFKWEKEENRTTGHGTGRADFDRIRKMYGED